MINMIILLIVFKSLSEFNLTLHTPDLEHKKGEMSLIILQKLKIRHNESQPSANIKQNRK